MAVQGCSNRKAACFLTREREKERERKKERKRERGRERERDTSNHMLHFLMNALHATPQAVSYNHSEATKGLVQIVEVLKTVVVSSLHERGSGAKILHMWELQNATASTTAAKPPHTIPNHYGMSGEPTQVSTGTSNGRLQKGQNEQQAQEQHKRPQTT